MATRALVLAVLLMVGCNRQSGPLELTAEAKAYTTNLSLSGIEMKAAEAFSGQSVVEVVGNIGNKGGRALKVVDVMCVFYDPYNQVVSRERASIVREKMGGLKPGETKPFRLAFDNLPATWNQAMPQLVIAGIVFE